MIERQSSEIIDDAIDFIMARASRPGSSHVPNAKQLREVLQDGLTRGKDEEPKISLVFKDVTYDQTKNDDFGQRVAKALPMHNGPWSEHFVAARESTAVKP